MSSGYDQLTDAELMAALARGGFAAQQAFDVLYQRHAGRLLVFLARGASREDAQELSQETWLRVHRSHASFDGQNFTAWLFKIARNVSIDRARQQTPTTVAPEEFDPVDSIAAAEQVLREMRLDLQPCWEKLSEDFRLVVELRLRGWDYKEIANEIEIPVSTAMTRWHRAKEDLTGCIERTEKRRP